MTKTKARPAGLEKALAQIGLALRDPRSPESRKQLCDALLTGSSIIAARVATSIAERRLEGFEDVLQQAFQRFLDDPVTADPGCRAKVAALGALDQLESTNVALFLAATDYVQIEGGGSRPADTAVGVRARAVVALARIGFPDLPLVAAHMLADAESPVRQAAADALGYHGERAGAGVLWLKLEIGDEDELVTLACASALLSLAPEWGLRALRPMLFEGDPSMQELSSLALGAARHEGALEMLFEFLDGTVVPQERALVLRGLGLSRSERAREYLLQKIKKGAAIEAKAAVAALGAHAHEPGLSDRVLEAARGNTRVDLRSDVAAAFPGR